jgi:C4-dicarboxylate-specific signal transduction histidine kinase
MGELTAAIAHEINQPLAALMSRKADMLFLDILRES